MFWRTNVWLKVLRHTTRRKIASGCGEFLEACGGIDLDSCRFGREVQKFRENWEKVFNFCIGVRWQPFVSRSYNWFIEYTCVPKACFNFFGLLEVIFALPRGIAAIVTKVHGNYRNTNTIRGTFVMLLVKSLSSPSRRCDAAKANHRCGGRSYFFDHAFVSHTLHVLYHMLFDCVSNAIAINKNGWTCPCKFKDTPMHTKTIDKQKQLAFEIHIEKTLSYGFLSLGICVLTSWQQGFRLWFLSMLHWFCHLVNL